VGCFTWYQSIGLPDKIKSSEKLFSKRKFKEAFLKEKYYFILKRQSPLPKAIGTISYPSF